MKLTRKQVKTAPSRLWFCWKFICVWYIRDKVDVLKNLEKALNTLRLCQVILGTSLLSPLCPHSNPDFNSSTVGEFVNFYMTYHTYIWNHAGWHRSVLNMTHFQLFAWFGQTLLVRKMENKSKFLLGDTIGSKFNFKWSSWVWTMSSYQNLRSI